MSQEPPPSSSDPSQGPGSPSLDERISKAIGSHNHAEAARLNTEGIALCPQNPKYHIGRAAANVLLQNFQEAITDAENALVLDQDHRIHRALPYLHMGRALIGLGDFDHSFTISNEGLKIDPGDWRLKQCMELARVAGISKRAASGTSPGMDNIGDTFDGGEMWLKLERDAEARGYRHDPEFQRKVSEARKDYLKLGKHLREDGRFLKAFGILLNVRFRESIGRSEPEVEVERQELEGNKVGNEVPLLEKLRRDMISTIVEYGPPDLTKLCQPLKEQKREAEKTAEELEEEAEEAELAKELLKLALEGAMIADEEARESCS